MEVGVALLVPESPGLRFDGEPGFGSRARTCGMLG